MGEITSENPEGNLEELKIIIDQKSYDIDALEEETILDAALRNHLSPPYSCKIGVCATCKAKLKKGKVSMENFSGLTSYDIESSFILTCQAKPLTRACEFDFDA